MTVQCFQLVGMDDVLPQKVANRIDQLFLELERLGIARSQMKAGPVTTTSEHGYFIGVQWGANDPTALLRAFREQCRNAGYPLVGIPAEDSEHIAVRAAFGWD